MNEIEFGRGGSTSRDVTLFRTGAGAATRLTETPEGLHVTAVLEPADYDPEYHARMRALIEQGPREWSLRLVWRPRKPPWKRNKASYPRRPR